jgi:NADPH:quinone reductase-like Zn-dependent oxidoreductase
VSQTDCFIRRGEWWGKRQVSLPNTPGVDIVGKLYRIDKESAQRTGLKKGDRVLSLIKWGGNSRYLSVDPEKLVKVPESVDPAEAACLAETYLTAFQLLHYSQSPGTRYRKTSLKGKIFLILGAITPNMGRAIAQLATFAGTDVIYATSKPKHFQQLKSLGFVPLSQDPVDWWDKLKGRVDLIISLGESVTPLAYKLIKASGEIVIATNSEIDLAPDVELIRQPSKLICTRGEAQRKSRTHLYDVFEEWDKDLGRCKKDLAHLVKLLETRAISPHVLDRVPLGKVARAQEIIESKRLSGFLVCEPWLLSKARALQL